MNPRTTAILDYLRTYHAAHGYAPTLAEIAEGVGMHSAPSVGPHLDKLVAAGAIRCDTHENGTRVTRGIV
jgi:SOS-response transcriptional repressor LexA